ncbi:MULTISPECIES: 4'-phosphopantetheinyl transferase family protein [Streptomyces]|uniref:4'-phosphopantetheinyl transferase superfamily protein n=1 Tax=Streptomyces tendae TaxID=1932 RepID=A0ABX5ZR86_STRTE|nr:4'-phosphopantetheinyl transferase superfamily protein [Streptomyces tendae]QER87194.1 4'-phosphopantetheinyl transferase superfamily protein [Streptomyces tendae]
MTDLWLLPESAWDALAERLGGERLLTEEERARYARMAVPRRRRQFLAGRLLCRYALSARTGWPVHAWRFTTGPYGRPEPFPDHHGVRFSVAHTDGLAVCAVTRGRTCGVDVECGPASVESAGHVARFLAPAERAELAGLPESERPARTRELWVLKEAYLKALGVGTHRSLDGFSFSPRTAPGITVTDPRQAHPAGWWFRLLRPTPRHALALAVHGGRPGRVRRTDLTDPAALGEPAVPSHV